MNAQEILTSSDKFHISLGLDRIGQILNLLQNPQDSLKIIHVAGTNGKGSVCAMLNEILIKNGLKTALYTSPHLFSYEERFKVNNRKISKKRLDFEVNYIADLAFKNNIHLTEFEILTAVAFRYFSLEKVDVAIMETGLGGRLDAVNIIKKPLVTVITSIDFDHKERLGDTIEKIALEKAGIIKENCPCVISEDNLGFKYINKNHKNLVKAKDDPSVKLGLKGKHQRKNLALVLEVLKHLPFKIDTEKTQLALKNVKWKYRLEYHKKKNILIDGCHNPAGALTLRQYLDENFTNKKIRFVMGCLAHKEWQKIISILVQPQDKLYWCNFSHKGSLKFEDLPLEIQKRTKIYKRKFPYNKNILTVYCGSLYMLGEIKP